MGDPTDFIRGLNAIFPQISKFADLTERIGVLEERCRRLQAELEKKQGKEDAVLHLERFQERSGRADTTAEYLKDKITELNGLRIADIQALTAAVEQRATKVNMGHLAKQVELLSDISGTKASTAMLDRVDRRVDALAEELGAGLRLQREEGCRLGERLQAAGDASALNATKSIARLAGRVAELGEEVSQATTAARTSELELRLQACCEENARKADATAFELLGGEVKGLVAEAARFDNRDMRLSHMERRVELLAGDVDLKATQSSFNNLESLVDAFNDRLEVWWTRAVAFQKLPEAEGESTRHCQIWQAPEHMGTAWCGSAGSPGTAW